MLVTFIGLPQKTRVPRDHRLLQVTYNLSLITFTSPSTGKRLAYDEVYLIQLDVEFQNPHIYEALAK